MHTTVLVFACARDTLENMLEVGIQQHTQPPPCPETHLDWPEFQYHKHHLCCLISTVIHDRLNDIFTDACTAAGNGDTHEENEAWRAYDDLVYGKINIQLRFQDIYQGTQHFLHTIFPTATHCHDTAKTVRRLTLELTQSIITCINTAARIYMTTIRTYPLYVADHTITANYSQLYNVLLTEMSTLLSSTELRVVHVGVCQDSDSESDTRSHNTTLDSEKLYSCPMHKILDLNFTLVNGVVRNRDTWKQMQIAFAMACHPRLGISSPANPLHTELVHAILHFK